MSDNAQIELTLRSDYQRLQREAQLHLGDLLASAEEADLARASEGQRLPLQGTELQCSATPTRSKFGRSCHLHQIRPILWVSRNACAIASAALIARPSAIADVNVASSSFAWTPRRSRSNARSSNG